MATGVSPRRAWTYQATVGLLTRYDHGGRNGMVDLTPGEEQLRGLLRCGASGMDTTGDGQIRIWRTEHDWQERSCLHPSYPGLLQEQRDAPAAPRELRPPHLVDIPDASLTTWVTLDAQRRLVAYDVRAGVTRDGLLIEAWTLRRETAAPDPVPPALFAEPNADAHLDLAADGPMEAQAVATATLTEASATARCRGGK